MDLEICHLLLLPVESASAEPPQPAFSPRDAPESFALEIEIRPAGSMTLEAGEASVEVSCQVLDSLVWLADCRYHLRDAFAQDAAHRSHRIERDLQEQLTGRVRVSGALRERYTIVLAERTPDPDGFGDANGAALASLVRALPKPPDELQIGEILDSRARFSHSDLTIGDWVGGVVITERGDPQSDIELFKIGKYQLLRYRMLDQAIERNLQALRDQLADPRGRWRPGRQRTISMVVEQRLELLLAFERTAQSLLLIGDWYSARVYSLISQRMHLDEWKATVSEKLTGLAAIDTTVRESLTFSWRRVLDLISLAGWTFLLIGYFVLFIVNNR